MYKFSPILSNTSPFRVVNGNLKVLEDSLPIDISITNGALIISLNVISGSEGAIVDPTTGDIIVTLNKRDVPDSIIFYKDTSGDIVGVYSNSIYKDVVNIDNSSLFNILVGNTALLDASTLTNYLIALGLPYILSQYIINNYYYTPPTIHITEEDRVVSVDLNNLFGYDQVSLDDTTTGKISLTVNDYGQAPNNIVTDPITGEVRAVYEDDQLHNFDSRFIQYYGVSNQNNPNNSEYWYRVGNRAKRLLDYSSEEEYAPTDLMYQYSSGSSVPVPSGITPDLDYQLSYLDDGDIIDELDNDDEEDLQYEVVQNTWINDRITLINSYTELLNELLIQIISINSSVSSPGNSIPLTRKNYISDYISFDNNVVPGGAEPILKSSDDLYYELELLEYCYSTEFDPGVPPVPVPGGIYPNRNYKLVYEQYVDDGDSSFTRIVQKGDIIEVIFEYKMQDNTPDNSTYISTINVMITQSVNSDGEVVPAIFKTYSGIIFEITIDNLVMYSTNSSITDYRIITARTII